MESYGIIDWDTKIRWNDFVMCRRFVRKSVFQLKNLKEESILESSSISKYVLLMLRWSWLYVQIICEIKAFCLPTVVVLIFHCTTWCFLFLVLPSAAVDFLFYFLLISLLLLGMLYYHWQVVVCCFCFFKGLGKNSSLIDYVLP